MKVHDFFLLFLFLGLLTAGCGRSPVAPEEVATPENTEVKNDPAQAEWTKEEGLLLPEEMQKDIGLKTSAVEKKPFKAKFKLDFQVFREARERSSSFYKMGLAYATIRVAKSADFLVDEAVDLKGDGFEGTGRILKVLEIPPAISRQNEILVSIPDPKNRLKITQFLQASVQAPDAVTNLVVPESAVLSTPEGTFAYRKEDDHFKKIAVEAGTASEGWIPISKGLEEGDTVVVSPLKTLWLTELQLQNAGNEP